ncbi:MAG TPA: tetratricopeptide repeat protein [Vicinamibacterales bacterium]
MLVRAMVVAAALSAFTTPAYADNRGASKAQVDFGIKVAQSGLWKEALYRWEKAVELDPTYAAAWNNLAIGYEHEGRFDDARKAYEKAVALDPKNMMIRQNYDLFKEINDRTKRRNDR